MKRYDLNLLIALDALLRERSVSGAARRIGIGQPAMSAALARLRVLFDDPILVRSGSSMQPTARARAISGPLRTTLANLDAMIEPSTPFDPAASERSFRLSGGDYIGMTVLPGLIERLKSAPRIDLRFRFLEKDTALTALDTDAIDLALLVKDDLPAQYGSETLIREEFIGAARADHPIFSQPIDAERFAAYDHLLITERGDATGCIDRALGAIGLSRRIAVTVPNCALVADALRVSDLVATVPARAGAKMAQSGSIRMFDPPVPLVGWTMRTVWAERNARDPGVLWLRQQLLLAASGTDKTDRVPSAANLSG